MNSTGQFFAVDRRVWAEICSLGRINPAVAYLVLARGTLGDLRTTSWSVNAIEDRTAIPRLAAKQAIQSLIDGGFIEKRRGGTKPKYYLRAYSDVIEARSSGTAFAEVAKGEPLADWIWLPNTIIDGANGETPPVERVRQSQVLPALRLYIDLYHTQSLAMDGGVSWRAIRKSYHSKKVGEWGAFNIFAFWPDELEVIEGTNLIKPFMTGLIEKNDEGIKEDSGLKFFFATFELLEMSGVVDIVPHAITADTDEGTVLHPMAQAGQGEAEEREVATAAQALGAAMLGLHRSGERYADEVLLLPVQRHIVHVSVVGLVRLRHRAKTKATAAWFEQMKEWQRWAERYRAHGRAVMGQEAAPTWRATSTGDQ